MYVPEGGRIDPELKESVASDNSSLSGTALFCINGRRVAPDAIEFVPVGDRKTVQSRCSISKIHM